MSQSTSSNTAGTTANGTAAYCDTLKQARSDFSSTDFTALTDSQFTKFRDRLQTLQDRAPATVQDDWRLLGSELDSVKRLLGQAGVSFNDLQKLQNNQMPPGFDITKFKAIVPKLQKLGTNKRLVSARNAIANNAKTTCHISMH